MVHQIVVIYEQNKDHSFDATIKGCDKVQVRNARDVGQARAYVRMFFWEEVGKPLIVEEIIRYCGGI